MNIFAMLSRRKRMFSRLFPLLIMLLTAAPSSWAKDFLLFYGNDVRGELQPCG
jgi:hypothetical protein